MDCVDIRWESSACTGHDIIGLRHNAVDLPHHGIRLEHDIINSRRIARLSPSECHNVP